MALVKTCEKGPLSILCEDYLGPIKSMFFKMSFIINKWNYLIKLMASLRWNFCTVRDHSVLSWNVYALLRNICLSQINILRWWRDACMFLFGSPSPLWKSRFRGGLKTNKFWILHQIVGVGVWYTKNGWIDQSQVLKYTTTKIFLDAVASLAATHVKNKLPIFLG